MAATQRAAVIGAGAAGLVVARRLRDAGLAVTVFEQATRVGGTWAFTDDTPEATGHDVHSSMYASLRTNLPKEVMAYPDVPFPSHLPSFLGHADVQRYLEDYAERFALRPLLRLRTKVTDVTPVETYELKQHGNDGQGTTTAEPGVTWRVQTVAAEDASNSSQASNSSAPETHTFDYVAVCNGHYFRPYTPAVAGAEVFPGRLMHSHSYRRPGPFKGQRVVVVGAASSGSDIAIELSKVCGRGSQPPQLPTDNCCRWATVADAWRCAGRRAR
eukprot:m.224849 g.224849  ORF g.224849 m.224849 type:complete len:272 (-) comp18777_c0_seq10:662-1477(-)